MKIFPTSLLWTNVTLRSKWTKSCKFNKALNSKCDLIATQVTKLNSGIWRKTMSRLRARAESSIVRPFSAINMMLKSVNWQDTCVFSCYVSLQKSWHLVIIMDGRVAKRSTPDHFLCLEDEEVILATYLSCLHVTIRSHWPDGNRRYTCSTYSQ